MISSLVGDWHSQSYLLNILALTAELKGPSVEQGLYDIVARLELLIPDNKVEWYCYVDPVRILRMAWQRRKNETQAENKSEQVFCEMRYIFLSKRNRTSFL